MLNPLYVEISDRRIYEPPRWLLRQQKAVKKPKPAPITLGQLSLFDSLEETA